VIEREGEREEETSAASRVRKEHERKTRMKSVGRISQTDSRR